MATPGVIKRWTILLHLYLGAALCLLFVVWFVSGVVMMYQSYPGLTLREKVAAMPALDCAGCRLSPEDAMARAGVRTLNGPLRLGMLLDRPVWRMQDSAGRWTAVRADDGTSLGVLSPQAAAPIATAFVGGAAGRVLDATPGVVAHYHGTLHDADQWTLTRTVRQQMPLYRFDLSDAAGTRVYVSPRSGEVLSASTRRERWVSMIGAIPHWIYPTILRRHAAAWSWVVIALSGIGTAMCLAGLAIGIWQWRWRRRGRRSSRARTPYRDAMMRWHHMLGLLFGVVTTTWVFSGLMSMNPGRWSPGSAPTAEQRLVMSGGAVDAGRFTIPADSALRVVNRAALRAGVKELHLAMVAGRPYWVGYFTADSALHLAADRHTSPVSAFPIAVLMARAAQLVPGAPMRDTSTLTWYDDYYRDQERQLPLPVLRVRYADRDGTWLYLDPRSGTVAQARGGKSRLERWLYDGLHDFDYAAIVYRRPLWDLLVIALSPCRSAARRCPRPGSCCRGGGHRPCGRVTGGCVVDRPSGRSLHRWTVSIASDSHLDNADRGVRRRTD
ncbi:MAG: PepSY domain-containing protein [Gemmatimonadaceae bacterium]|nr:PepSY domain-containing protein [Gemmatimonadaceae bacterium]